MDNILLLFFLFFIIERKKKKEVLEIGEEMIIIEEKSENIPENTFTLNINRSQDKIKIMKKIGHYFPEEYINPINKAILITEQILSLYATMEFIKEPKINYIESSVPMLDNRERISSIMNTIRNEVSKDEVKDMGLVLDIIFNMDKYKSLFAMLTTFVSDPNSLNEPEKIIKLAESFMEGKNEEEKKKMREMMKMLEVLKNLDKK